MTAQVTVEEVLDVAEDYAWAVARYHHGVERNDGDRQAWYAAMCSQQARLVEMVEALAALPQSPRCADE